MTKLLSTKRLGSQSHSVWPQPVAVIVGLIEQYLLHIKTLFLHFTLASSLCARVRVVVCSHPNIYDDVTGIFPYLILQLHLIHSDDLFN